MLTHAVNLESTQSRHGHLTELERHSIGTVLPRPSPCDALPSRTQHRLGRWDSGQLAHHWNADVLREVPKQKTGRQHFHHQSRGFRPGGHRHHQPVCGRRQVYTLMNQCGLISCSCVVNDC